MRRRRADSGAGLTEFAVLYSSVVLPLTFMIVFVSEMLWIWHSVADFTRDGARYAATHCWLPDASNVLSYMEANVPLMIDQTQFQAGTAGIAVDYMQQDPSTGSLLEFACNSAACKRRLHSRHGERQHHQLPVHALFRLFQTPAGYHSALHHQCVHGQHGLRPIGELRAMTSITRGEPHA